MTFCPQLLKRAYFKKKKKSSQHALVTGLSSGTIVSPWGRWFSSFLQISRSPWVISIERGIRMIFFLLETDENANIWRSCQHRRRQRPLLIILQLPSPNTNFAHRGRPLLSTDNNSWTTLKSKLQQIWACPGQKQSGSGFHGYRFWHYQPQTFSIPRWQNSSNFKAVKDSFRANFN